jgi:hypothetical protein
MSRGLGRVQRAILEALEGGQWVESDELTRAAYGIGVSVAIDCWAHGKCPPWCDREHAFRAKDGRSWPLKEHPGYATWRERNPEHWAHWATRAASYSNAACTCLPGPTDAQLTAVRRAVRGLASAGLVHNIPGRARRMGTPEQERLRELEATQRLAELTRLVNPARARERASINGYARALEAAAKRSLYPIGRHPGTHN